MNDKIDNPFHQWVRLEQPRLGTQVVFATDDFFADKSRLIDPADPVFIPDKYDENGKWMDGWESRRKREPGHDFCVVKLGIPGVVRGLDIDTSHFTGNFPPHASVDACISENDIPADSADWFELLPKAELQGDAHQLFPVENENAITHLRLNIFPDGGVARLRVFGEVKPYRSSMDEDEVIDLLALENGGRALLCNDEHFGSMRWKIAGDERKLALIRAHPDLAGKAAISGQLTEESTSEQSSAGIDQCSPEEFERFQELNSQYKEKFGFPFVMAVRDSHRHEILAAFKSRLANDSQTEFETAIREIHKIASLRLQELKV